MKQKSCFKYISKFNKYQLKTIFLKGKKNNLGDINKEYKTFSGNHFKAKNLRKYGELI